MKNLMNIYPERIDLDNCAYEPLQFCNKIQNTGFLFSLEINSLTILQVSENAGVFLNIELESLLNKPLAQFINPQHLKLIQEWLPSRDFKFITPFLLEFEIGIEKLEFSAVLHISEEHLVLECEKNPPESKNYNYANFYHLVQLAIFKLEQSFSVEDLLESLTQQVHFMTGYDRVMVYRFMPDGHGEVLAETKSSHIHDSYLGLHYPATDIPQQARQLYLKNWVRHISDISYSPSPLYPKLLPDTQKPLDLSHSILRSISPICVEYFKNMGVKSTLVISIVTNNQLWGLISCHHYSVKFLEYQMRSACELLGKMFSYHIVHKQERQEFNYAQYIRNQEEQLFKIVIQNKINLPTSLTAYPTTLLNLNQAKGAAVYFNQEITLLGKTPDSITTQLLIAWIGNHLQEGIFYTHELPKLYPEAEKFKQFACGVLAISLSSQTTDMILWFIPEYLQTVYWAGNPANHYIYEDGSIRLNPRHSFAKWQQDVKNQSLLWKNSEIEVARRLREHLMDVLAAQSLELIETNRGLEQAYEDIENRLRKRTQTLEMVNQKLKLEILERKKTEQNLRHAKALAEEMNRLKTNFLANMSHEIRTPMNGIMGIVQLIEKKFSDNSHLKTYTSLLNESTQRLLNTLTSLLDVANIEAHNLDFRLVELNIVNIALEVINRCRPLAQQKQLTLIYEEPVEPYYIIGEKDILTKIFTHLVDNAIKFTEEGSVKVQFSEIIQDTGKIYISFKVSDTGVGVSKEFLSKLFQPFTQESEGFGRQFEGSGLGLSIVKRYAELFGGMIMVESTKGKGSIFEVRFPLHQA